jgi:hypothetical protein
MTCCIALKTKDKGKTSILMGADSAACDDNEVRSALDTKISQSGPFTLSYAGDVRVGQVLKYSFIPPEPPKDPEDLFCFMITDFVDSLVRIMKKNGLWIKNKLIGETELIVVVLSRVFYVGDDLCVLEMEDDMVSIGAGAELALGSLFTSAGLPPRDRVLAALKAAAHFCPWVKEPYTILKCT